MKKLMILRKNKLFIILMIVTIFIITLTLVTPYLAPNDPLKVNMKNALETSSYKFPLGTDNLGRCLYSRLLYATRNSLKMTFLLVTIVFIVGTSLGVIAGYFGGITDTIIMRISDIFLAFPGIIFAIAIAGILGASSVNTIIALAIVDWVKYARVSRSLVVSIRKKDYIKAAKMAANKEYQIILKYILPNMISSVIVMVAMDVGTKMLEISSLSFLGLGTQPPTPEWGYMLNEGRNYMQTAPWIMVYPGITIFIVVMIFNLFGDSIRDLLDVNKKIEWRK